MPRQIKFRAWSNKRKEMLLVKDLYWFNPIEGINNGISAVICDKVFGYDREEIQDGDVEIMEYTGLKDKNGKEIYEGDIIKYDFDDGDGEEENNIVAEVLWSDFSCGFKLKINDKEGPYSIDFWDDEDMWTFEVVGNIYENPNLLCQ